MDAQSFDKDPLATQIALAQINHTVGIVTAAVGRMPISTADVPAFIAQVHTAVTALYSGAHAAAPADEKLEPAVAIRKSITPDFIICLDDGKKFKSLKRHLRTHYNLSPEQYRARWGLPDDYPMVAPNYSATRSKLAKANGLGKKAA